ncbi:MAG: sigma-70 family RNA polymerase sigma factor [Pirellulales bacterium]
MPPQPAASTAKHSDPGEWVDRYGDTLLRYAAARVGQTELAEDLVQETFLLAFRHRAKFDGKSAFGTWLVAILRRRIADHYRKSGRSPEVSEEALVDSPRPFSDKGKWLQSPANWRASPEQLIENAEFWGVFHDCLDDLPGHLGQAFQMREIGARSTAEISQQVGITPKNLAVRLHRARLLLRACLERKWFCSPRGAAR